MKRRVKLVEIWIVALTLLIGAFGGSVAAAEENQAVLSAVREGNAIRIRADFQEETGVATMMVLYPGQELVWEYNTPTDATGRISDIQMKTIENGALDFLLPMREDGPFGLYKIRVAYAGQTYETSCRYTKSGAAYEEELRDKLNGGADVLSTLLEYEDLVLLDGDWFDSAPTDLVTYFVSEVSAMIPMTDIGLFLEEVDTIAKKVYAIDEINQASDVEAFKEALTKHRNLFSLSFDPKAEEDDVKALIDQAFKKLPFKTAKEVTALNEAYVLGKVNAASWGGYRKLIKQYAAIGIRDIDAELADMTEEKSNALFQNLAEKAPFASLSAFQTAFYASRTWAMQQTTPSQSHIGGGGGGGRLPSASAVSGPVAVGAEDVEKPVIEETKPVFTDIDSVPWAKESIIQLVDLGAVSGMGDGTFMPNDAVTREQFIKMALNAFGITVQSGRPPFDDVQSGAWYENYVYTACQKNIVNGISETAFGIGEAITRQDAVVILNRIMTAKNLTVDLTLQGGMPKDADQIAEYAVEAVTELFGAKVLSGDENGCFCPEDCLTRAEAAKMICGILNNVR